MAISVQSGKAKGRKFQQWVRDTILTYGKRHGIMPEDVKSTSMGAQGEDVQLSRFAREFFPWCIECKAHKSFVVYKVYEQAEGHGGHEPVVFLKADRKKPLAVVDAEYLIKLQSENDNE